MISSCYAIREFAPKQVAPIACEIDEWALNGSKLWITNGSFAHVLV
jgi:alkylation response protein AidB-like acyl-CoA dehydrogenase